MIIIRLPLEIQNSCFQYLELNTNLSKATFSMPFLMPVVNINQFSFPLVLILLDFSWDITWPDGLEDPHFKVPICHWVLES